ncbi:MAG: hypothetical protein GY725_15880 [bacterium]|nr:hypothetical protein [bacterium]
MPGNLSVRCECGSLHGTVRAVSADVGNRLVCYCSDCQSFAYFLERADTILDAYGGSDIFQMSPAHLEISKGREHLACMRLTKDGLLRWYANCCKTPIGNTLRTGQVPFVGLILNCLESASEGQSHARLLGPIRARVNARQAKQKWSELDAHDRAPASMILRFMRILFAARWRGDHKRSLFFDLQTGEPTATPRILSDEELRRVEAARDAG